MPARPKHRDIRFEYHKDLSISDKVRKNIKDKTLGQKKEIFRREFHLPHMSSRSSRVIRPSKRFLMEEEYFTSPKKAKRDSVCSVTSPTMEVTSPLPGIAIIRIYVYLIFVTIISVCLS